ncbi:MAG: sulfotransferase family protein [Gammaproteobacteria bacterium]|nr:sulfotransferase family protein [Gammaproteobacteria bacterium]
MKPVCLWSGPRNVSTALMYSFAQLDNVRAIDEPLYGHYLRVTGAAHPGRDEIIAAMNCDGQAVMDELIRTQRENPLPRLFVKHMAHHLVDLDLAFLARTCNVFLIRDPHEMLPSLTIQLPNAELVDTGLKRQSQLFDKMRDKGRAPLVLDSRELLLNPSYVLQQLCQAIGLPFSESMLKWPAGERAEDGVWAPHWYHAVHQSTGFQAYREKTDFPATLLPLLEECQPWYEHLFAHALRAYQVGEKQ